MNLEIANQLVELRKAHDLSQEDLAAKLGVSRQAVSKWERAESSPDTDNLIALAQLYGISLDAMLLHGTATSVPPSHQETHSWEEQERERRRSLYLKFPYPVFMVLCYMVMGFSFHLWHPGWLLFLTIPLYYWFAANI